MIFESFSRPKARDFSIPSDDVLLHVPGRMSGVFDGASDSLGRKIGGVPIGRVAALAAANAAASLPLHAFHWPAEDILNRLSTALATTIKLGPSQGAASTTAMIAFEGPDSVRLLGIGDTGYRINGGAACISELAPDLITIPARVALFKHFQTRGDTAESCEISARTGIGKGFLHAISEGVLTKATADKIIQRVLDQAAPKQWEQEALRLLNDGIQSQYRLANATHSPLGYGVLNGQNPDMRHAIDVQIPLNELKTIEIFSDGYMKVPDDVSIAAWENRHAEIEHMDPHKISEALAVKGSTQHNYFDDRTISILRLE